MSGCRICGKELTSADVDGVCWPCKNRVPSVPLQFGWQCPRCGSVYSPTVTECWRCSPGYVVTSSPVCT